MESNQIHVSTACKKLQFTDVVGKFGKWQLIICFHVWLTVMANVMNNMIITFHAPNIDYHCSMPEDMKKYNLTKVAWISHGIPREDDGSLSRCSRYETWDTESANRTTVPCDQWDYDTSTYTNTIVSAFDLVCDRKWKTSLLKSCYMFGYLAAGLVCGISDRFGRRPVIFFCISLFLVASMWSAFSTSFTVLAVLRFLTAVGITTCTTVTFILQAELVGPKERISVSYIRSSCWACGMLILLGIAYFVRDWMWLQISVTLPVVFLAISIWWFVPESPRFLLTHGHKAEALAVLKTAARWNKKTIDNEEAVLTELIDGIERDNKENTHASYFDLFQTPEMRKRTLLLFLLWSSIILQYYGIAYNTNHLHGDMYINFATSAAVEMPGILIFYLASRYFGRRKSLFVGMSLAGCCMLLSFFLSRDDSLILIVSLMIAKGVIGGSSTNMYIYTAEIMPTVVRNIGMGSCSTFSRFGGIAAPFAMESLGSGNVRLFFGILSLVTGLSILLLPETHNIDILDTIKETRNSFRKREEFTKV